MCRACFLWWLGLDAGTFEIGVSLRDLGCGVYARSNCVVTGSLKWYWLDVRFGEFIFNGSFNCITGCERSAVVRITKLESHFIVFDAYVTWVDLVSICSFWAFIEVQWHNRLKVLSLFLQSKAWSAFLHGQYPLNELLNLVITSWHIYWGQASWKHADFLNYSGLYLLLNGLINFAAGLFAIDTADRCWFTFREER